MERLTVAATKIINTGVTRKWTDYYMRSENAIPSESPANKSTSNAAQGVMFTLVRTLTYQSKSNINRKFKTEQRKTFK